MTDSTECNLIIINKNETGYVDCNYCQQRITHLHFKERFVFE